MKQRGKPARHPARTKNAEMMDAETPVENAKKGKHARPQGSVRQNASQTARTKNAEMTDVRVPAEYAPKAYSVPPARASVLQNASQTARTKNAETMGAEISAASVPTERSAQKAEYARPHAHPAVKEKSVEMTAAKVPAEAAKKTFCASIPNVNRNANPFVKTWSAATTAAVEVADNAPKDPPVLKGRVSKTAKPIAQA